jgi:hypothetical protein
MILVTWMLISTIQRFTQNGICFSLLGLGTKMTLSHITWTIEKFISSLHVTMRFSDGMSCHKTSAPYYLPYVPLFSESESLAEE